MVTVAVVLPPEFIAVTVYTVDAASTVGVPERTPVLVSKLSPVESAGDIAHDVIAPPEVVGERVLIATSLVKVKEDGE